MTALSRGLRLTIGHFTFVCQFPGHCLEARLNLTMFCYKPSCFERVNGDVHDLVTLRITRIAHERQEGL